jgi:hypothetical protein
MYLDAGKERKPVEVARATCVVEAWTALGEHSIMPNTWHQFDRPEGALPARFERTLRARKGTNMGERDERGGGGTSARPLHERHRRQCAWHPR